MHKDYKHRRASAVETQIKKSLPEKHVDPAALERFRRLAYQQEYQRKYGKNVQTGRQQGNNAKQ